MVKAGGFKVTIIIALIIAAVYFSLGPIQTQTNLGLDLQGGAHVVLEAKPEEGQEVTPEIMESVTAIIRERVDSFGVSEPLIQREGDRRVIVELAGIDNPEDAIAMLGKTARLEFRAPNGDVIVTGADLKEVTPQKDGRTNENVIALRFTPEGAEAFGAITVIFFVNPDKVCILLVAIFPAPITTTSFSHRSTNSGKYAPILFPSLAHIHPVFSP